MNKITPAGAARIERELAHLHPAFVEDELLREELANLELRIPRLQAKINSTWRYLWTLGWAGTRVAERDAIVFATALKRRRTILQRRSELAEFVDKYKLYMRDGEARFQSSPGVFLNLTDGGRHLIERLQFFYRAFAHSTLADLQKLLVTADNVLDTYLELQTSTSLERRAMPAYLAARTLANAELEDILHAHKEILRQPSLHFKETLSLLLTSFQFDKDPLDVVHDYNTLAFDNFIHNNELAAPLIALGYKHQNSPERFAALVNEREELDRLHELPRQTWPGLISISLYKNRSLAQAIAGARRLLQGLGEGYSRQIPSLVSAVWHSRSSFEDAVFLVRTIGNEDLAVESDAAGLATLVLSTGLEKADVLAIYRYVRMRNLESDSDAGPLTAIVLRRVIEEWRILHGADVEPSFFDEYLDDFLEMDYATLTEDLFGSS